MVFHTSFSTRANSSLLISRHEFIRLVREFYLSNDPDAPGSLFFGHI
ncbi:hypothetical protein QZN11_04100 [Streptomyces gramineus]